MKIKLGMHQNDSSKWVNLGEPQFSVRRAREVTEMVTKMKSVLSKTRSHKQENENKKECSAFRATSQAGSLSYPPFGCSKEDLSGELTMDEINKLISSCIFFVSRKKAYIIFYHYSNYLKRMFRDMVSKLSK
ncbi:RAD protein [Plasmodium cynomolgi strain B]|uniref:RAD protein n=1 Tax=Plasmodium cynomolgi (strain B) TaxID=1120755 RepID=K6UT79_PLACD|nr:RAD protein [Plasmodium cynomolgi strain B]GAB65285.1 RAD protein [Plasmodium cynomolgi strain B]